MKHHQKNRTEDWRMCMNPVSCGNCRELIVSAVRTEGARHRRNRQPCEDVIWMRTTRDYLFCGLADGQSGTKYGPEGGRICLEAVADYIDSAGIAAILEAPFPDELPCAMVKAFRRQLLSFAQSSAVSRKELASTLLAVVVERKTGNYVLLHLGDGYAVSVPQAGDPVLISAPENGIASYHTWLTTSDTAVAHLRVTFGTLEDKKRLLLATDGAVCFCRGRNLMGRAKELLKDAGQSRILEYLQQSDPVDDAACIVMDVQKTDIEKAGCAWER